MMNLSPYWIPKDPSGVQLILYLRPSVRTSLCLSVQSSASHFGNNLSGPQLCAVHAATCHVVKYPAWKYNMSVCPVVREPFTIFVFVLIPSVGVSLAMHLL